MLATLHNFVAADYFRLLTLGLVMSAIGSFPYAVHRQGRHWSAWFAVAGCECFMLLAALAISDHFGDPIVWHRTPLAFAGAILVLIFNFHVFMANRNKEGSL